MENKRVMQKIIDIILIVAIIVCVFALLNQCDNEIERRNVPYSLTQSERQYILENLNKRNANNCI